MGRKNPSHKAGAPSQRLIPVFLQPSQGRRSIPSGGPQKPRWQVGRWRGDICLSMFLILHLLPMAQRRELG